MAGRVAKRESIHSGVVRTVAAQRLHNGVVGAGGGRWPGGRTSTAVVDVMQSCRGGGDVSQISVLYKYVLWVRPA